MGTLSRSNLQEFCRICLTKLEIGSAHCVKSREELQNLMLIYSTEAPTSQDLYPQRICGMCFNKFTEFQDFRRLMVESTLRIEQVLRAPENSQTDEEKDDQERVNQEEEFCPLPADPSSPIIKVEQEFLEPKIELEFEAEEEQIQESRITPPDDVSSRTQSGDDDESGTNSPTPQRRERKSFQCPHCDKVFQRQVHLDRHMCRVHGELVKPFVCTTCNESFSRFIQLQAHTLKGHPNPDDPVSAKRAEALEKLKEMMELSLEHYTCRQCGKQYCSKRTLKAHLKRHLDIRDFVCTICGMAKVSRTQLHTHMRTYHEIEKFKCSLCPQEFNHKTAILRHVRAVHERERKFKCSFCSRSFATKYTKMCHEERHKSEKNYKCAVCSRGYKRRESLKAHMRRHNVNEDTVATENLEDLRREATHLQCLLQRRSKRVIDQREFQRE